ncbi:MAG: biopolymer transporter ExbD [Gallionellaceae bacterium]|nr:biopolymer transporter ExbD [Gallionellaceae bacterium]
MKNTRRLKRMTRNRVKVPNISLTSLMDVFIVMVIYLLMNQALGVDTPPPKAIKLPDSVVDAIPRQTVMMMVSNTDVVIHGKPVVTIAEILASEEDNITAVTERMEQIKQSTLGINDEAVANSTEVTIMADRSVPFKVLRKLMSSSASAGYSKISLAVNKKEK